METYRANYRCDHDVVGDITKIHVDQIPEHDVLLAGFPCQPFSIAGVSKKNALQRPHGFLCEAQGTLFFDVARIINHCRPKAFLLENVKNLLNHDRGRTFEVIRRSLSEELGYHIHTRVIDARSFVPQHRERILIVGFQEPNGFSFDDLILPDPAGGPRLATILHPEDGSESADSDYTEPGNGRVLSKYTLTDHLSNYLRGSVCLLTDMGVVAASWSFTSLLQIWNRKHAQAVYVPGEVRMQPDRQYRYGNTVRLAEDTNFNRFVRAVAACQVYYDPGIKLENESARKPLVKRRSQFRIRSSDLPALYDRMSDQDVMVI